jgi:hypothetical protein
MHRARSLVVAASALAALAWGAFASAQTPAASPYSTTKVADNVYVFRAGFYQSMFVVTPEGVIATDPIGYADPRAPAAYLAEIRKITQAPVKYVIYSHGRGAVDGSGLSERKRPHHRRLCGHSETYYQVRRTDPVGRDEVRRTQVEISRSNL